MKIFRARYWVTVLAFFIIGLTAFAVERSLDKPATVLSENARATSIHISKIPTLAADLLRLLGIGDVNADSGSKNITYLPEKHTDFILAATPDTPFPATSPSSLKPSTNSNKATAPLTPREVAIRFEELSLRAKRGDVEAARVLYKTLEDCESAPRSLEHVQKLKEEVTTLSKTKFNPRQVELASFLQKQFEEQYGRCHFFKSDQITTRLEWLDLAAQHGDNQARLAFYEEVARPHPEDPLWTLKRSEYEPKVLPYLELAVRDGTKSAVLALGNMYEEGRLVSYDPQLVYTYKYAYTLLWGLRNSSIPNATAPYLQRLRSKLTETQVQEAERRAEAIVDACCLSSQTGQ